MFKICLNVTGSQWQRNVLEEQLWTKLILDFWWKNPECKVSTKDICFVGIRVTWLKDIRDRDENDNLFPLFACKALVHQT
jgi:hypothetical protein